MAFGLQTTNRNRFNSSVFVLFFYWNLRASNRSSGVCVCFATFYPFSTSHRKTGTECELHLHESTKHTHTAHSYSIQCSTIRYNVCRRVASKSLHFHKFCLFKTQKPNVCTIPNIKVKHTSITHTHMHGYSALHIHSKSTTKCYTIYTSCINVVCLSIPCTCQHNHCWPLCVKWYGHRCSLY